MNNLLKGKKGIIFGALDEKSIAWKVAEKCKDQGAIFTLTNAPIALRMGQINKLAEKCNSKVIPADVTSKAVLKENSFTLSSLLSGERLVITNILVPSLLKTTFWGLVAVEEPPVATSTSTLPDNSGSACAELTKVRLKIKHIENIIFIKLSILIKIYLIETS